MERAAKSAVARLLFRPGSWLVAATLMATTSACSAKTDAPEAGVMFLCQFDAPKMAKLDMAEEALCALIKAEVDSALALTTRMADAGKVPEGPDWVTVELRQASPVTMTAIVRQKSAGQATVHPELSVDVSDKAISQSDVAMLAGEIAKAVAKAAVK